VRALDAKLRVATALPVDETHENNPLQITPPRNFLITPAGRNIGNYERDHKKKKKREAGKWEVELRSSCFSSSFVVFVIPPLKRGRMERLN